MTQQNKRRTNIRPSDEPVHAATHHSVRKNPRKSQTSKIANLESRKPRKSQTSKIANVENRKRRKSQKSKIEIVENLKTSKTSKRRKFENVNVENVENFAYRTATFFSARWLTGWVRASVSE